MSEKLFERLQEIYPEMVSFRRDLHMYPELSHQEVNTPEKVAGFLENLGVEVRRNVGGRGVTGLLKGGKPGKTVALRADFDALPIQEENEVEYKSRIPGVMHACGHDIHTAALLGVAKILSEVKDQLEGNVLFIHQFAEEVIPGGAKSMIEDGCLDGADVIYGAHVWSTNPTGTVGVREGDAMAAGDTFEINIFGKGGHAATPHLTVDPIAAGSQLISNLQQVVARKVDPVKTAVVSVAAFNSGTGFNVIPDKARITGTVRTFDEDVRSMIESLIGEIAHSTCRAIGATAKYEYVRGYPAVKNHPGETKRIERLAGKLVGEENVIHMPAQMGMEDFAYYLQKVPGTFFFVGGNSEKIEEFPHHHPRFDVDERSMLDIGKVFISAVFDYLSDKSAVEKKTAEVQSN
ncbi:M20 family metallopeptidase [Cytobacillus oceanisediminis]|uniref:M20 family metallopeptidase n=1 Tax=Cytobacillus oceanisediminis TaxID=665099 RepID=UPI0023D9C10F|nr:M20 family metallopeptidase [Cytobacillus oceanisediminis]MDF2037786.1 M20 family metallopeptidase [Cytobacillus oceanisediminis]